MRLLLTNDDGIRSPGLHALIERAAAAGHDVVVAASLEEWEATDLVDAVLSGVHAGATTGHAVVDSPTLDVVHTAARSGIPGVAVSLDIAGNGRRHWETAALAAVAVVPWVVDCDPAVVLNVNVPNAPIHAVRGVCAAGFATAGWSDSAVLREGFVAVTPLCLPDGPAGVGVLRAVAVVERALASASSGSSRSAAPARV